MLVGTRRRDVVERSLPDDRRCVRVVYCTCGVGRRGRLAAWRRPAVIAETDPLRPVAVAAVRRGLLGGVSRQGRHRGGGAECDEECDRPLQAAQHHVHGTHRPHRPHHTGMM